MVARGSGIRVGAGAGIGVGNRLRPPMTLFVVTQIFWLPLQSLQDSRSAALLAFVMSEALGSRPAPGTPSAKRSVGTRRAASMQDTLSEGTARAAQLAPSAVTASAVGGSATRSVVDRVSPTTSGSSTPHDRACSSTCQLIASRMVFRAQGESPASCARERGLNPPHRCCNTY